MSKQHRTGEGLPPPLTSILALDHVGQRNLAPLAPSRDANLGALHGDYAVLHANLSNGVGKHLFSDTRDTDQRRQSKPGQTCRKPCRIAAVTENRGPTFSGGIFWDMLSRAYSGVWAYTPLKVMFAQLSKRLILPFRGVGQK